MTGEEKIREAGRLVAEAFAEADPVNPYARMMLTQHLADVNLMQLDVARRAHKSLAV